MPNLSTKELAVEHGARIFDAVEPDIEKAHDRLLGMVDVIAAGRDLDMMGALATGRLKGQAMEAAGSLGVALRQIYQLHRDLTDIAIENEVDPPQPRDGGGHR